MVMRTLISVGPGNPYHGFSGRRIKNEVTGQLGQ
jgi:hypothetical protein